MKKSLAMAIGTVMMLSAGMPVAQGVKAPTSSPGATATQSGASMMGQMDEHMKKMQALHEKMASATTPEERQKLMIEQRQEMQQGMAMMHDMPQGGAMMGMGMMGQKGKPADQRTQMQMMEKRMDMMQMMMQSMMDQQGVSGSGMMPAPTK